MFGLRGHGRSDYTIPGTVDRNVAERRVRGVCLTREPKPYDLTRNHRCRPATRSKTWRTSSPSLSAWRALARLARLARLTLLALLVLKLVLKLRQLARLEEASRI